MDLADAKAIYDQGREAAVETLLELSRKAELYDKLLANKETAPSGSKPPYEKENLHGDKKKRQKPGRKKGHPGASRKMPPKVDREVHHRLSECPECGEPLGDPVETRGRIIEDIPLEKGWILPRLDRAKKTQERV